MIKKLSFCFKGERDYIQGADIVDRLIKDFSHKKISNIDIKFNGITTTNLSMVEGHDEIDANVNIHWEESGCEKFYQLVKNNEPVECRYEYDEEKIIRNTSIRLEDKLISLYVNSGYTLCENFVAMNKYLLHSLFPDKTGKWYFTRLELVGQVDNDSLIKVKLIKNFNFRLTKSHIILNDKIIGSVYFTLVKV